MQLFNIFKKKYVYLPIVIAIIAGVLMSAVKLAFFTDHDESVSASLELLYEGAAEGLSPNGEHFNIDNLKNDDNLLAAIAAAGLDLSAEELRDCIVIRGVYPDDFAQQQTKFDSLLDFSASREVNQSDYNPVKFNISLSDGFKKKLSKKELLKLFSCIMEQYQSYFARHYSSVVNWDAIESVGTNPEPDYTQELELMQYELNIMQTHCAKLAGVDATFEVDGFSFSDLNSACESFGSNTLSNLLASISLGGYSKDADRMNGRYGFRLMELENDKEELEENLADIDGLIASYSKDSSIYVSSEQGAATVQSNSNSTYEALVTLKKDYSEKIVGINEEINKVKIDMAQSKETMNAGQVAVPAKLEENMASARTGMAGLKEQFAKLCDGFNEKYASKEVLKLSSASYNGANRIPMQLITNAVKF